jgi:hypothetical protein
MTNLKDASADLLVIATEHPDLRESILGGLEQLRDDLRNEEEEVPESARKHSMGSNDAIEDIPAWKELTRIFGKLRRFDLISIARGVQLMNDNIPKIGRKHKRSTLVLVQWMEQNWNDIFPSLSHMHFFDQEGKLIEADAEIQGDGS